MVTKAFKENVQQLLSETIRKITLLDAYLLPRINEQINEFSKYKYFGIIDLKSAFYPDK